jgi:two-component system sensor histidine kinase SenX3
MKVFLALLALSGWALAIAFRVIATREQKRRMFAELTPTHSEHIPLLPVDAILDSLPLGVVVVDINGREQFRNSVARDASGARHEAVLIDAVIERLSRLAVNGSAATEQMELVGPPLRVLVVSAVPSTSTGAVITVEDITERWRLDQVRTDFVANVSHELKTPVGAISVLAETLEGETEDELVKTLVRRMVMESHRMASTIDDLLELSRIELGGEMDVSPVDINEVVSDAIERSQPLANKRHVSVQCSPAEGNSTIMGDRFQILSAVGNLVENAIKYSEDNAEVKVQITTSDSQVVIEVIDHGVGIPVASLDRIFERFYRVDRARSRDTGGTGLGLSIVRHVVTNHGGEVNVRSREGEGSTFSLTLPRQREGTGTTMVTNDERADRHG